MRMTLQPEPTLRFSLATLLTPFDRLRDVTGAGWLLSLLGAALNYASTDLFTGAVLLVVLSGMFDYYVGRKVAKLNGEFSPTIAHMGAVGKLSGIALLFLIRALEFFLHQHSLIDSHGIVASAIAISLFAVDLESISHHREALGARPIPVLSFVIVKINEKGKALVAAALGGEK